MTYSVPPTKSILHDVMTKMNQAIIQKDMPFAILVGDMPVYRMILDIKSEHMDTFQNIIPFLGPFHMHLSFIQPTVNDSKEPVSLAYYWQLM